VGFKRTAEPGKFKAIEQYANENEYGFQVWTDWTMLPAAWKESALEKDYYEDLAAWKESAASIEEPMRPIRNGKAAPAQQSNWGCLVFIVAVVLFYLLMSYISR